MLASRQLKEDDDLGFCELSFQKRPELVSVVRRFVSDFHERTLADPDANSRVALATHELLENALKYARDGKATVRIEVSAQGANAHIRVRTQNRAAGIATVLAETDVQRNEAAIDARGVA